MYNAFVSNSDMTESKSILRNEVKCCVAFEQLANAALERNM